MKYEEENGTIREPAGPYFYTKNEFKTERDEDVPIRTKPQPQQFRCTDTSLPLPNALPAKLSALLGRQRPSLPPHPDA